MDNKEILEETIRRCWCKETSNCPNRWSPENPIVGQSLITALVIQDYLKGEILKKQGMQNGRLVNYFFNCIDDKKVCFTMENGNAFEQIGEDFYITPALRRDILSSPTITKRYSLLKEKVDRNLPYPL